MKWARSQTLLTALVFILGTGMLTACSTAPEQEEREQRDMLEGLDDARDRLDRQTN